MVYFAPRNITEPPAHCSTALSITIGVEESMMEDLLKRKTKGKKRKSTAQTICPKSKRRRPLAERSASWDVDSSMDSMEDTLMARYEILE